MAWYLDTSALVKLVVAEAETPALWRWLAADDRRPVTCDLGVTELRRAVGCGSPERIAMARLVLDTLTVVALARNTFLWAAQLDPPEMRSLDALHLAAALDLGDSLDGIVAYDVRLAAAADRHGIPVVAPA